MFYIYIYMWFVNHLSGACTSIKLRFSRREVPLPERLPPAGGDSFHDAIGSP